MANTPPNLAVTSNMQNTPEARSKVTEEVMNEIGGALNARARLTADDNAIFLKLLSVSKQLLVRVTDLEKENAELRGAVRELQQIFNQKVLSAGPIR